MNSFAGLDVSIEETAICVVDEHGEVLLKTAVPTDPQLIADRWSRGRKPSKEWDTRLVRCRPGSIPS
jgi:predicted NBD/HSP70 family sugar kinase